MDKIRVGISSCLLGENVRYNGGHKLDTYLRDTLGEYFEYVPVCPEFEAGFGVPRESIRLVGEVENPKILTTKTAIDKTSQMQSLVRKRVSELAAENLCAYIFKSKSPSCGMERVKVYPEKEGPMPIKKGVGLFARAFMESFPNLPTEEEGRLNDIHLRENFIERVFVMRRWQLFERSPAGFLDFHSKHKLLVMAHSVTAYRELGRMLADFKNQNLDDLMHPYLEVLMRALKMRATPKKITNVLMHVMGYFKNELSSDEKVELLEMIKSYHDKQIPLSVPVSLLNHYVRKYDQQYLHEQYFLNPHPTELKLRNYC